MVWEWILSFRWHKDTSSVCSLWAVILRSMHTPHSPFSFTALLAHKSQATGLTMTTLSKITDNIPTARVSALNSMSHLTVKMLHNWVTSPLFQLFLPENLPSCCCFPCCGCLSEATCQWVTTCSKIWLTCFMWHFNFLSVNQCSCCIFLIALLDWQLMIDPVLG